VVVLLIFFTGGQQCYKNNDLKKTRWVQISDKEFLGITKYTINKKILFPKIKGLKQPVPKREKNLIIE
jgi:hypothetical protein